jgi:hypothetical protein
VRTTAYLLGTATEIAVKGRRGDSYGRGVAGLFACLTAFACSDAADAPGAPRPAPEHLIAASYCAAVAPTWVAFRDGDGAWERAQPEIADGKTRFRHAFTSSRAAIASFAPIDGALTLLRVLYGTPAELATESDTTDSDCFEGNFKTLHGTVSGLDATQAAFVGIGSTGRAAILPRFGLDFTIDGVAPGSQDLLASRTSPLGAPRLIVRRGLDLAEGSEIPSLDFAAAEAFDMVVPSLTIVNGGANGAVNLSVLRTAHGEFFLPIASSGAGSTQPYFGIPADKLLGGELEQLEVTSNGATSRVAEVYFRSPTNRTVTLGDDITAPAISAIAGSIQPRLRAHYAEQADYDKLTSVVYQQPTSNGFIAISMTPAYAALAGGYDIDVPDLLNTPGFDPSWALRQGVVNWTALRSGGTLAIGRDVIPFDGATRRTSIIAGTLTLP